MSRMIRYRYDSMLPDLIPPESELKKLYAGVHRMKLALSRLPRAVLDILSNIQLTAMFFVYAEPEFKTTAFHPPQIPAPSFKVVKRLINQTDKLTRDNDTEMRMKVCDAYINSTLLKCIYRYMKLGLNIDRSTNLRRISTRRLRRT